MADFPDSVFTLRDIQNIPQMTYDPDKKTTIYAEDLQNLGDEITAIEEFLEPAKSHEFHPTVINLFTGTPINLGDGGDCTIRWQRVGDFINASMSLYFGAGHDEFEGVIAPVLEGQMPPISYVGNASLAGGGAGLIENSPLNKSYNVIFGVTAAFGTLLLFGAFGGDVSDGGQLVGNSLPVSIGEGYYLAGTFGYWAEGA